MIAPALWIALRPIQDLALCARSPRALISARSVPWQPPSTTPSVGSSKIAKSALSQSGACLLSRSRPLRSDSTSSQS